jgi:hypothetical protein
MLQEKVKNERSSDAGTHDEMEPDPRANCTSRRGDRRAGEPFGTP